MNDHHEVAPKAISWFKAYTALISLMYLAILGTGLWLIIHPEVLLSLDDVTVDEANLAVGVYCGIGLVFALVFGAGLFLKREPWHWLAGALLIAMSLGLCVTVLPGFVLFYFWLQPEVRHWFGRD